MATDERTSGADLMCLLISEGGTSSDSLMAVGSLPFPCQRPSSFFTVLSPDVTLSFRISAERFSSSVAGTEPLLATEDNCLLVS